MNGTANCATRFGWPLAWATMAGAKPHSTAPTNAAGRERTRCRLNTWYQAEAVSHSARVSITANATGAPQIRVTGASGMVSPSAEVLAIRFTPSGKFISLEKNGFSGCTNSRAACASIHSNWVWSPGLLASNRCRTSFHR